MGLLPPSPSQSPLPARGTVVVDENGKELGPCVRVRKVLIRVSKFGDAVEEEEKADEEVPREKLRR